MKQAFALGGCPASLHVAWIIVEIKRHIEFRTLRLDAGCHLAAAVHLDKVGKGASTQMMEIGVGQTYILAVEPGMPRREAGEADTLERLVDGCPVYMEAMRRPAGRDQVMNHRRNGACVRWSELLLGRQKDIDRRQRVEGAKRANVFGMIFGWRHVAFQAVAMWRSVVILC